MDSSDPERPVELSAVNYTDAPLPPLESNTDATDGPSYKVKPVTSVTKSFEKHSFGSKYSVSKARKKSVKPFRENGRSSSQVQPHDSLDSSISGKKKKAKSKAR